MLEFRRIVYSANENDATIAYDEALNSETASEYQNYQEYLQHWWDRRQQWCLAWRTPQHRGHHTNNFAEITVRLYKDIIFCSAKAYNVISLVDFTVRVLENYYRNRLRDFSNGRVSVQRLLMEKLHTRASYLYSCDQMTDYHGDNKYGVPNSDGTELYMVDSTLGCCTCFDGMTGKFCKHQSAVMRLFHAAFPNAPAVTAEARHAVASIALGANCPPMDFYRGFQNEQTNSIVADHSFENTTHSVSDNVGNQSDAMNRPTQEESPGHRSTAMTTLLEEYQRVMAAQCARFESDATCRNALQNALTRLKGVNTASGFASFLHGLGFRR